MGMDGIGGVGALNVSSQTRVTRPQSETVDVNTGSTARAAAGTGCKLTADRWKGQQQ